MSQRIHLDATPGLFHQVLHCHQGDVGRQFEIAVVTRDGYEIPSGATFKIQATKPSGLGFTVTGTAANNIISFTSTEDMTSEAGEIPTQLEIKSGNDVIYTSNFLLVCEKNTHPESVTDGSPEEIISEITLLVERAESAASTAGADAAAAAQARVDEMMDHLPSEVADLKSDINDISEPINLIDGVVQGVRIGSNGYDYSDSDYFTTDFIPVVVGEKYYKNSPTIDAYHRMALYDSNYETVRVISDSNTVTVESGVAFARLCGELEELDSTAFYSNVKVKSTAGKIRNLLFVNLNKGVIASSSDPHYGELANSSILNTTDYIEVGDCSCISGDMPHYSASTVFGLVFYDKNKLPIIGYTLNAYGFYGIESRKFPVPFGAKYFRASEFADSETYGETTYYRTYSGYKDFIFIAASNSSVIDKTNADYVCDGTNDEYEIQSAINQSNGKVVLAEGDYYIDSFPNSEGYGISSALHFGANAQQNITVEGAGYGTSRKEGTANQFTGGAIIHVSSDCYSSLSNSAQYAIFASVSNGATRKYPWTKVNIENIAFVIPDNQKKIICIDGWMMSALSFKNIYAMAVEDASNLKVPVDGCIAVRGLQGSNFGINNRWESSFVWGFYEGYAVSGEHIVGIDLGSRFCNYGFTFNRKTNAVGAWIHPITMINCCDECNFNLPIFGNSGESGKSDGLSGRQTIDLIDYNLEWLSQYSALGGNLATELNAGQTYGSITFTEQPSYGGNSKNNVAAQFWADGYGRNMRTINMAHAESGTSAERATYFPQYMQKYFDTTLNKLLIYNGTNWVDTMGNLLT